MGIIGYVLLGLVAVGGVYVMTLYNNLVRLKHTVTTNWANIDVLLKQRHDELPNLVETCKAYMKHERETLEAVMKARTAVANDSFRHVQARISQLENTIADRRELYNATVNNLNIRIEQFPDVVVARNLGFGPAELLEFHEAELKNVSMKKLFD